MKALLTLLIFSLLTSISFAQSNKLLLNEEQAFRSFHFNILELSIQENALNDISYGRHPYSDDEGFVYLNLADSLVVLYCPSASGFKISERLHVKQLYQTKPIVVTAHNDEQENVIMKIVEKPSLRIQFYYPGTKINGPLGEQMMAYEFGDLVRIKKH